MGPETDRRPSLDRLLDDRSPSAAVARALLAYPALLMVIPALMLRAAVAPESSFGWFGLFFLPIGGLVCLVAGIRISVRWHLDQNARAMTFVAALAGTVGGFMIGARIVGSALVVECDGRYECPF